MPKLILLVGPPGSGKSTYALDLISSPNETGKIVGWVYVNQDTQGKDGHLNIFKEAIKLGHNIIVDRMDFDKKQRDRYLIPAKQAGYETEIVVLHVPRDTCFERIMKREDHPTINGMEAQIESGSAQDLINARNIEKARQANSALDTFFTKYERVEDSEADKVTRLGWVDSIYKTPTILFDLDGTMCNIDHRLHHVQNPDKKQRRWDLFNKLIPNDSVNEWCRTLYKYMCHHPKILCSGRVDSSRKDTETWLEKHDIKGYRHLFMRHRNDPRDDTIVKEIMLEFEIKTRYQVLFAVDDRPKVCRMWRKHDIVCLQCNDKEF